MLNNLKFVVSTIAVLAATMSTAFASVPMAHRGVKRGARRGAAEGVQADRIAVSSG